MQLAPPAPPCWHSRSSWLEYLTAAAEAQTPKNPGPLDLRRAEPAFNWRHDFCAPCTAKYALSMQTLGRCHPTYLRSLAQAAAPEREKS